MAEVTAHKRDGVATRARIEREALRLFAQKGFDGASIRDISLSVGVADPALYRYFASKEDLGRSLFLKHYGALARAVTRIGEQPGGIGAKIDALVGLFCQLFDDQPDVFAFILLSQHSHLRFVPDSSADNVVDCLCRLIDAAARHGEIAPADVNLTAAMALGAVVQPAIFALYGRLPRPLIAQAGAIAKAARLVVGVR